MDSYTLKNGYKIWERYEIINPLGKGGFGEVYKCKFENKEFAVKIIKKISKNSEKYSIQEINNQINLTHKNICMLEAYFQDDLQYILVFEYCNKGNLLQYLLSKNKDEFQPLQPVSEEKAKDYMKQIINAFKHIHTIKKKSDSSKTMAHRDLKLLNILVSEVNGEEILKVGDFGLSKFISGIPEKQTRAGTELYMSPEVYQNKKYDSRTDIYSLGLIFYILLFGETPPKNHNKQERPDLNFNINGIQISDQSKTLLASMLCYNQNQRITFDRLFRHPYFSKQYNIQIFFEEFNVAQKFIEVAKNDQENCQQQLELITKQCNNIKIDFKDYELNFFFSTESSINQITDQQWRNQDVIILLIKNNINQKIIENQLNLWIAQVMSKGKQAYDLIIFLFQCDGVTMESQNLTNIDPLQNNFIQKAKNQKMIQTVELIQVNAQQIDQKVKQCLETIIKCDIKHQVIDHQFLSRPSQIQKNCWDNLKDNCQIF